MERKAHTFPVLHKNGREIKAEKDSSLEREQGEQKQDNIKRNNKNK